MSVLFTLWNGLEGVVFGKCWDCLGQLGTFWDKLGHQGTTGDTEGRLTQHRLSKNLTA